LGRINSVAVYVHKGKYYLDGGQVLSIIPAREAAYQYQPEGVKVTGSNIISHHN